MGLWFVFAPAIVCSGTAGVQAMMQIFSYLWNGVVVIAKIVVKQFNIQKFLQV